MSKAKIAKEFILKHGFITYRDIIDLTGTTQPRGVKVALNKLLCKSGYSLSKGVRREHMHDSGYHNEYYLRKGESSK